MKYYLAYGSNLNVDQMRKRCPDAKKICSYGLMNYRLMFRAGLATIEPQSGFMVPCGIWQISDRDEKHLDVYEGFPNLYAKKHLEVLIPDPDDITGRLVTAMAYVMVPGRPFAQPSSTYFKTIYKGYADFSLGKATLLEAVAYAMDREDMYV